MYRARDRLDNEEWVGAIEAGAGRLDLAEGAEEEVAAIATDLFLSAVPDAERSKRAAAAASLYAATLLAGEERSQAAVADAMGVARLSVQQRWKRVLERAGFDAPEW